MKTYKVAAALAAALMAAACGPGVGDASSRLSSHRGSELSSDNGLTANGLTTNGMTTNGMTTNGLSLYGLANSALTFTTFTAWFALNPSYANMVMTYVVRCAVPAGQTRSFYSLINRTNYVWQGELGLAPVWASGQAIPVGEQQLVSACMAAHTNKYGVHVNLSVRGPTNNSQMISVGNSEMATFNQKEGCFFGNLFDGTGVYSGYSSFAPMVDPNQTSLRACAINGGQTGLCQNITSAGPCGSHCWGGDQNHPDTICSFNGKSYLPISTWIQPSDVNFCGDGVCQQSESCYDPRTGFGCQADCGTCP